MRKRTWWRWVLAVVLVIVACVALVPRPKLLMDKARKMPYSEAQMDIEPVVWHSDQDRYVLRQVAKTDHFGVFLQDISTGKLTPMEAFNTAFASQLIGNKPPAAMRLLAQSGPAQLILPSVALFSPDHQWLLWNSDPLNAAPRGAVKPSNIVHAYSLDGQREIHWKLTSTARRWRRYAEWLPDSRRWLELLYDNTFFLYGVTIHSLDTPTDDATKMFVSRGSRWPLGITPDAHLLSYEPNSPPPFPALIYYDTPLDDAAPVSRKITIPLPRDTKLHNVYLSPDGTLLLWHLTTQTHLTGLPLVQQIFAHLGIHPEQQEGLWISHLDGKDLHEIGHIPVKALAQQANGRLNPLTQQVLQQMMAFREEMYGIQWLPDGKRILFEHGSDVYTVPVD